MKDDVNQDIPKKKNRFVVGLITVLLLLFSVLMIIFIVMYIRGDIFTNEVITTDTKIRESEALERLRKDSIYADVITEYQMEGQKVTLTFEGLLNEEITQQIIDTLDQYQLKAIFFMTGEDVRKYPESVRLIDESGHELGNHTLKKEKNMENYSSEELVENFVKAENIIQGITNETVHMLRCYVTEYTDHVTKAAGSLGYDIMDVTQTVNHTSFNSLEQTQSYINRMNYMDILAIRLSGIIEIEEYETEIILPSSVPEVPASDGDVEQPKDIENPDEKILQVVEWIAYSIKNTNYDKRVDKLREENGGNQVEPISHIHTIEKAVAYLFCGLGNSVELQYVLDALDTVDGKGTFFVTKDEIEAYPEEIQSIIEREHNLGIAVNSNLINDFSSALYEMLYIKDIMLEKFNYEVRSVMQLWGTASEELLEAISALDLAYIQYDRALMSDGLKEIEDAEEYLNKRFGERKFTLTRGETLCVLMSFFQGRDDLLAEIIIKMEECRNIYEIKPVEEIVANSLIYTYPVAANDIMSDVYNQVYKGKYDEISFEVLSERFYGDPNKNIDQMSGFTLQEFNKLNHTGVIQNDDNAVFLTIDDWGTDETITKLLDVLDKYDAKATFFVYTEHIENNPNLLRAIAAGGHEISSHTHGHIPINEMLEDDLTEDVVLSYQVLQNIVGDMRTELGTPVLTKILRPPTTAVSKESIGTILSCGYDFVVNYYYTSHDYEAISSIQLFNEINANMKSGAIINLHMSDTSVYTAEALDLLFEANAKKPKHEQYKFARLSDYLDVE